MNIETGDHERDPLWLEMGTALHTNQRMDWITLSIALFALGLVFLPRLRWMRVREAKGRVRDGAILLDVRSPMEVAGSSVEGAVAVPLGSLARVVPGLGWTPDQEILVFCASGARSAMAVRELKAMGFARAVNIGSFGRARSVAQGL